MYHQPSQSHNYGDYLVLFPDLSLFFFLVFAFSIVHRSRTGRPGNTYHMTYTCGRCRGRAVPTYKYVRYKLRVSFLLAMQVEYSQVLTILWTSGILPSNIALDNKAYSVSFRCGPLPPTSTLLPPDVIHVITIFFCCSSPMYYTIQ